MAIVQDAYDIPDDIVTGLATGLFSRFGSVIRYASGTQKGRIYTHLKSIDQEIPDQPSSMSDKVIGFVHEHKKGTIAAGIGIAILGIGVWAYNKIHNSDPQELINFRIALQQYIDAIRKGDMSIEYIDALMNAIEELKMSKKSRKLYLQITTEEFETLVNCIYKYTIKLARDNDIELEDQKLNTAHSSNCGVIYDLQECLRTQKKIFAEAA